MQKLSSRFVFAGLGLSIMFDYLFVLQKAFRCLIQYLGHLKCFGNTGPKLV